MILVDYHQVYELCHKCVKKLWHNIELVFTLGIMVRENANLSKYSPTFCSLKILLPLLKHPLQTKGGPFLSLIFLKKVRLYKN